MTRTITPTDDAAQMRSLLLWARAESIVVTEITVGSVTMHVNDLKLAAAVAPTTKQLSDEEAKLNLYAQYGGKVLEDAEQQAELGGILEDEDD